MLPLDPTAALRRGLFQRIPVMLGQTRDEHRLLAGILADESAPITPAQYAGLIKESFGAQARNQPVRAP